MCQTTAVLPHVEGRTGLPVTTDYWRSVSRIGTDAVLIVREEGNKKSSYPSPGCGRCLRGLGHNLAKFQVLELSYLLLSLKKSVQHHVDSYHPFLSIVGIVSII